MLLATVMFVVSMPQQSTLVVNSHKWIKCMAAELANHKLPTSKTAIPSCWIMIDLYVYIKTSTFHPLVYTLSLLELQASYYSSTRESRNPYNEIIIISMEDSGEQIVTEVDDTKVGDRYYV